MEHTSPVTLEMFEELVALSPHNDVPLEVDLRLVLGLLRRQASSALAYQVVGGRTQIRYRGQLLQDVRPD